MEIYFLKLSNLPLFLWCLFCF